MKVEAVQAIVINTGKGLPEHIHILCVDSSEKSSAAFLIILFSSTPEYLHGVLLICLRVC